MGASDFLSHNARARGHTMNLKGGKFKTNRRKYLFPLHVIRLWNSLPQKIIVAKNLARFKKALDIYMDT